MGTYNQDERYPFGAIWLRGDFPMFKSFRAPPAAIASFCAVIAATLFGGSVVLLSGVLEVRAASKTNTTVYQTKSDRLVMSKGAACSALGWPNYERRCQFDMRQPAEDVGTIRVIALR